MNEAETARVSQIRRQQIPLFSKPGEERSWTDFLIKADDKDVAASNQGVEEGRKEHPFNMGGTGRFMTANTYHASCIAAKVAASIGLGLVKEDVEEKLDELCDVAWQETSAKVAEDLENCGNGYFEIVRAASGEIVGIHHLYAPGVWVFLDDTVTMDFHYEIQSKEGTERRFARFGDSARFREKYAGKIGVSTGNAEGADTTSEVIHLKEPTSLSRWYGVPRWLPAVSAVELTMAILQHNYDFFNNRGVPEFMLFVLGGTVDEEDWRQIENKIQEHIGLGNGYKSLAANLPGKDLKVQLEKLGLDSESEGTFDKMLETLSQMIVSGHQVPPQLAGILIPGKLGAANELPNAMATFQTLVAGPRQRLWGSVLGCTLGKDGLGIDGIKRRDFEWNKITEEIDLPTMDAVSRTRRPLGDGVAPEGEGPQGGNRAPDAGTPAARLADMQKELTTEDRVKVIVDVYTNVMRDLLAA